MSLKKTIIEQIAHAEAQDYEEIHPNELNCHVGTVMCDIIIGLVIVISVVAIVTIAIVMFNWMLKNNNCKRNDIIFNYFLIILNNI